MGGGASSPSLALDHLPAPHLPTELIEGLHDVALSRASRALVKSARKFCGQLFAFLCADLPGVIQVCFVPHQDQGDIFGLFNFIQQVLKRQHLLEAASVRDVVNQHEALTPSHVSFFLNGILLLEKTDTSLRNLIYEEDGRPSGRCWSSKAYKAVHICFTLYFTYHLFHHVAQEIYSTQCRELHRPVQCEHLPCFKREKDLTMTNLLFTSVRILG